MLLCKLCKHGRNLVGDTGDVLPHFFRRGGHNMSSPPTFFALGFVFGEVSKIKVMFVTFLCEELSNVRREATHSQVDVETEFGVVSLILLVYKV